MSLANIIIEPTFQGGWILALAIWLLILILRVNRLETKIEKLEA